MDKTCRFFCTAGRGTEVFLEKELKETLGKDLSEVTVTDGKVFYELTGEVDNFKKILTLKTAERAFVQVFRVQTQDLDQRHLIYSLKSKLGNKDAWQDSMTVLQYLQNTSSEVKTTDTCTIVKGANYVEQETSKQNDTHSSLDSEDEPKCKKLRLNENEILQDISFRVNFKCPACFRKRLNIKSVPKDIGVHIKQLTGWKIDLRNPQVEICVQLNKEYLTVGFPVTREPLSKRSFIKLIGLRSTVAYIMSDLLQIQKGEMVLDPMCGKATLLLEASHHHKGALIKEKFYKADWFTINSCLYHVRSSPDSGEMVLDPMCGKATLLLEASHHHKEARYIGIDKSESQLNMARENIKFVKTDNIELIHGNCTGLPFPDDSIDKVVTDAPFGNNHTTDIPLEQFYKAILCEISRVLKPTGKLVLLTSTSIENLLRRTASKSPILTSGEHNDSGCCDQRTTLIDNDVGHDTNDVFKNGEADHLSKAAHENTYTCIEQTDEPCDKSVKVCKSFCKEDNSHSNSYGHDRIILDTGKLEEFNSSTKDSELSSERVLVDENSQNLKALDKTHGILETVETSESFKADIADKEQVLGNEIPQNLKTLDETRGISKTVETLKSVKADIVDKEQVSVNDIPQTLKALDGTHGISETVETSESVKADIADKERVSVNDIPQNLKALDGTSKAFKFCEISEAVETSESLKADIVVKDTCSAEDKMKQQQGNETSESVKADIVVKDTGSAEDKMKQQGKETIDLCDTYSSSEIIGDEKVNIQKDSKMQNLVLLESHYIKLGETDSYVCVFEKQDRI